MYLKILLPYNRILICKVFIIVTLWFINNSAIWRYILAKIFKSLFEALSFLFKI